MAIMADDTHIDVSPEKQQHSSTLEAAAPHHLSNSSTSSHGPPHDQDAMAQPLPISTSPPPPPVALPSGWMYNRFRIGKHEFWYASPAIQLIMVSMVCFLCPGMFNALSGLGAGGQVDATAQDHANTALYTTFAVVAFFSGSVVNTVGVRPCLAVGGLGYCIYAVAFLVYNHAQNIGFVIFAGALLGFCAGLLWTAQGALMMAYPPEHAKGRFISCFWLIFNTGAVIGSLIPLGQNINRREGPVTDGTYAGFIVLMFIGAVLGLFLCSAAAVVRPDGSRIILMKNPTFKTELVGLVETLTHQPWIVLLFPLFFVSNIFYVYQFNGFNIYFNTRTRALNNLVYWLSQILGALAFGHALDAPRLCRPLRAKLSLVTLAVLTFAIWGGGWAWQRQQPSRAALAGAGNNVVRIDWTAGAGAFVAPLFLYAFMGFYDAAWQTCIYWYLGALSNSGRKAANLAGFYKAFQSAGAAVFWALDGRKTEFNVIFGATWGLLAGSLLFAAPIIWTKIKDTVSVEEDLKDTDETIDDVAPHTIHHDDEPAKVKAESEKAVAV